MLKIVDIMLKGLSKRVAEVGLGLEVTDAAKQLLAQKGYDPMYGARPLRRLIQSLVEDKFSEAMLDGVVQAGHEAVVDVDGDEIVIHGQTMPTAIAGESGGTDVPSESSESEKPAPADEVNP
jgi:ATP-dependent Clp protease ATP-binding subunit ClpC